jgi:superfamily I DNA/RNA helicase
MSFTDIASTLTEIKEINPTVEQQEIIDLAIQSDESILINALAGAAKTTTLELICRAMPVMPILSLAFNKRIAEEMARRLPGHVQCRTLNSLGHRVWAATCTGKINLQQKKSYELLKRHVENLSRIEKQEAFDRFGDTLKAISKAKLAGYIPDGKYTQARRLTTTEQFWNQIEEDELDADRTLVDQVLTESIRQAYAGLIDFDDQIYMSTLFGGTFPRFPLVMCDEVQDLSEINHAMLERLVTQRLIAVGDPHQSIYRFRGAKSSGMAALKAKFKMTEMGLSISFRCPIAIIKNAHFRAPRMMWPDWAKEGTIARLRGWDADTIRDGAAIICRNNAPLISLAFKLLRRGRGVKLVGFDIGSNLIKVLKKLGPENTKQEDVVRAIDKWEAERLLSKKNEANTKDKAECLRVFSSFGPDLGQAIAYATDLFAQSGPIQLLSGHKAKGLEWDVVYHLDPWRIPSTFAKTEEDFEQELNVRYVVETRAKDSMFFINTEDFEKNEADEGL